MPSQPISLDAAEQERPISLWKALGPGLIFAGSAIGVSHLVQATRAGALFGMGLVLVILLSHLAKYPGFLFAPRYSAATGLSILDSYRRQGAYALVFYGVATLLTMFIAAAANLLVTVGLVQITLGLEIGELPVAVVLSAAGMAVLLIGHYHLLELVIKVLVVLLTIATVTTTALVVPLIDWGLSGALVPSHMDLATILFIAALIGWMPTPFDVSVWHSLWTVAKMKDSKQMPTLRESKLDFDIGYVMTALLAICFVILGTAAMHGSGEVFESSSARFAGQVIDVYRVALGDWSAYLVGLAAVGVMFSTWLSILDGFPRGLSALIETVLDNGEQKPGADAIADGAATENRYYWPAMVLMVAGAFVILYFFFDSFKGLIDLAATVSFLTAPVYAYLNHRAITDQHVPELAQPSKALKAWSMVGIAVLTLFALAYLYVSVFA